MEIHLSQDRDFDVNVFGASGFTRRLVAECLVGRHGVDGDVDWAMAARSHDKHETVLDEIGAPGSTPLVVADSDNPASLRAIATRARCLIATVGSNAWYVKKGH